MADALLKTIRSDELDDSLHDPVDEQTLAIARDIISEVRRGGDEALRRFAEKFGDIDPSAPMLIGREELSRAFHSLKEEDQRLLLRTRDHIRRFATAQMECIKPLTLSLEAGRAGHDITPVKSAGCYAPGGRFPMPSSVLMTVVPARSAGVESVIVASPRPTVETLAAAHVAGADLLLAVGGAQAVAAMAYGTGDVANCDVIVGPGNRYVTAAKKLVSGVAGIDMLAGPSELTVLADDTADPAVIAADLLAQAEHDTVALPVLVTASEHLIERVNDELAKQLPLLSTKETAGPAIANGFAVLTGDMKEARATCDRLAPEHLEVMTRDPEKTAAKLNHYGALFIGGQSAEVFGDYGAGPNHVLPTGGTARFTGGLSVFTFLRIRTWLKLEAGESAESLINDAARLARMEGLEGHARAAEKRKK